MDRDKLVQAIDRSGYRREFIAKKVGLSPYGLAKKINGHNEFKVGEAKELSKLLGLTDQEAVAIFLS